MDNPQAMNGAESLVKTLLANGVDTCFANPGTSEMHFVAALDPGALKGKKLGVVRGLSGYNEKTQVVFDEAVQVLTTQGAEVVDVPKELFEDLLPEMRIILLYDFKEDLNAYLGGTPAAVKTRTLADLIAFSKSDARESMHGVNIFSGFDLTNLPRPDSRRPVPGRSLDRVASRTDNPGISLFRQAERDQEETGE